jgi:DNA-binding IclR family transcriptional regulator
MRLRAGPGGVGAVKDITTDGAEEGEGDRQFVTALGRGFAILQAFTQRDTMLGNREIAERTGLPKPTVSRLTYTLMRLGYLTYLPRLAKYQLGLGAVALGQLALGNLSIRQVARPHMQRLAAEMDATVSLGGRDRLSMLYIEHCPPPSAVALQLNIGSRIPLAVTAMGRAYFAAAGAEERAEIAAKLAERHGRDFKAIEAGLKEAVDMHAAFGFTISVGDWNAEVHAAAAAVALPDGTVLAMNCGAPAFSMSRERVLREAGPRVAAAAKAVAVLAGR